MAAKPSIKHVLFTLAMGIIGIAIHKGNRRSGAGSIPKGLKYDNLDVSGGIRQVYRNLPHLNKINVVFWGAIILLLFAFDEETSKWFGEQEKKVPGILKDFGWYFGSPENHYVITGGFYLYSLFTHNETVRRTGVLLITATSIVGILQTLMKIMIGRARPIRGEGKASFLPYSKENTYYSFPSGHSILSFSTTYSIGKQFNNPWYKSTMYALGTVAPLSRLLARAHWVTDAITSLLISVYIVNSIDNHLQKDSLNSFETQ